MMKIIKRNEGLTLIEIIITLVIFAVIITAVYNVYFSSSRTFVYNKEKLEFQRTEDLLNKWVSRYVRQANEIDTSIPKELSVKYNTNDTTDEIKFGLSSENIFIVDTGSGIRTLSEQKLTDLTFQIVNGTIEMKGTIISNDSDKTYSFVNVFSPRLPSVQYVTP